MTILTPSGLGIAGLPTDPAADAPRLARRDRTRSTRRSAVWPAPTRLGARRLACGLPVLDLVLAVVVAAAFGAGPVGSGRPDGALAPFALALVWGLALAATGAWQPVDADRSRAAVRVPLRAGALTGLACWLAQATVVPAAPARQLAALTAILVVASLLPRLLVALRQRPVRLVLAGSADDVRRATGEVLRASASRWEVVASCHLDEPAAPACPDVAAGPDGADSPDGAVADASTAPVTVARAHGADAILALPGRDLDPVALRRLAWAADDAGLRLLVGTGLLDVVPSRVRSVSVGQLHLAEVRAASEDAPPRLAKAALERALAVLALVVLLPVLAAVALAIRVDSPGGALFRQCRVGRAGERFVMLKFRTMRADAEQVLAELEDLNEHDEVLFKVRRDPRVTRIGRVLRRYSLDELPQLLNVVRGEMSLIGPRPALPHEVQQYDVDPRRRLAVKPGLTGLWQVSGRSDLSWEESVRLDLHYVDNWSLGLDARIIGRTLGAVLGHRGAY